MECLVVTKEGRGGGTWVHPQVGYHLGQWISPAFAVKVTEWISDLHAHGFTTVEGATITAANSREVKQVFGDYMSIARMIGLDKNQAALAANTATVKVCGVNPLEQIGATHLLAPQQEPHLTATQVAEQSGLRSAQAANKKLEECGYQVRELHSDAGWRATPKGERFAIWLDTGKRHNGGAPVRQLRWSASVVPALRADMGASQ
jgi:hypothetical protein